MARVVAAAVGIIGGAFGFFISSANLFVDFLSLLAGDILAEVATPVLNCALIALFLLALAASILVLAGFKSGATLLAASTLGTAILGYIELPPYARPFGPSLPEGLEPVPFYVYSISATPLLAAATLLALLAIRFSSSVSG